MATGYGISPQQIQDAVEGGLQQQENARRTQDQQSLQYLQQLSRQREADRGRTVGEVAGDSALSLLSGAVGLGQAAYGIGNIATLGTLDRATGGFSQNFGETQEAIRGWQSDPLNAQRAEANAAFDDGLASGAGAYLSNPSLLLDLGLQAAPSLVPTVAAGNLAARTVGSIAGRQAAQKAATTAAIRTAGAQVAGGVNVDAVDTLREQGVDGVEQQLLGVGAGVGAGLLGAGISRLTGAGAFEGAVGSRLGGLAGTGGGAVRGAVTGGLREAGEEALQSGTETAAVNAVAPENALMQDVGQSAVVGGIAGGILGAPMGAVAGTNPPQPAAPTAPDPAAEAAAQGQQYMDAVREAEQAARPATNAEAINQRVGVGQSTGATEADFLTAVDMEMRRRFYPMPDGQGGETFMVTDPDTQTLRPVTPEEAGVVEAQVRGQADLLGAAPQWESIAQRQQAQGETAPDFNLAPTGQEGAAEQGELALTPEEQTDFAMGEQMIQAGLLLEDEQGNVSVNPEQASLFDAANQGMTGDEARAARDALAQRVQELRQRVRPTVEEATGLTQQAGITEDDLLTSRQARRQEREAREEATIQRLFRVEQNDNGETVYRRYNRDLQRMEEVERGVAVREAKAAIKAEDEAAAEAARQPADRWRDWLDQNPELDVRKNSLNSKNKEWQRFSEQANELGVQPDSEEAGTFLQRMANELGGPEQESSAGKLGAALGTAFPVDTSVEGRAEVAATQAAEDAIEKGEDPLPAATEAADTAAEQALERADEQVGAQREAQDRRLEASLGAQNTADAIAAQDQAQAERAPSFGDELRRREREGLPLTSQVVGRDNLPFKDKQAANKAKNTKWLKELAAENNVEMKNLKAEALPDDRGYVLRVTNYDDSPVVDNETATGEPQTDSSLAGEPQAAEPEPTREAVLAQQGREAQRETIASAAQSIQQAVTNRYARMARKGDSREKFMKRGGAPILRDELVLANSPDDLDTMFSAITQTETYRLLDDAQRKELGAAYNARLAQLDRGAFMRVSPDDNAVIDYRTAAQKEDGSDGLPPRSPRRKKPKQAQPETPLTEADRDAMLAKAPGVTMHATVSDYKAATGRAAPADAAGVFDEDGVHVVMENIKSKEHFAEVLAHEDAHKGINDFLGERLTAVTNRLWANAALRERIREKMRTQSLDRAVAAEEVLVDMLANNERLTGDVWSKLRSAAQSTFESLLGVSKYRVTDRQVDALLDDVAKTMRGDEVAFRNDGLLDEAGFLDAIIGKPDAITKDVRFSRVRETMDSVVSRENPAKGNYNDLSYVTREAVDATRNRLKDIAPEVRSGRLGRVFMPFMPLNQMYNMWGRNFETTITKEDGTTESRNPFRDLNTLKGEQEARFNQRLVRKRKMDYNGETIEAAVLDISDQASDFQLRNPEQATKLNSVLQESTYFQVWPDRPWDKQPEVNYQRMNMTEKDRQRAWKEINTQWGAIGKEGQDLYKKIQASYKDQWRSRVEAMEAELRRVRGIPEGEPMPPIKMLELARRELSGGPYSPLTRHGNYLVIVRSENGVEHYSAYDTQTEAERARVSMAQQYPAEKGFSVARTMKAEEANYRAGLNQEQLAALEDAVADALPEGVDPSLEKSLRDSLTETYLKMLPASSFGQFSNRRRNVSGYSMDGIRAFAEYSMKSARNISSIEYDGRISNALLGMQQTIRERQVENLRRQEAGEPPLENINTDVEQDVLNHVKNQHEAALRKNFNKLASMLSGAGFLYMMTSPSQLVVNASQTFLIAMPRLGARYGGSKTLRVGNDAIKQFFRTGRDLLGQRALDDGAVDKGTQSVLQRLFEDGTLDFTFAHDVTDVANGDVGQLRAGWRRSMQFLSKWIHDSEVFNRQVTAYMATKMHAEEAGFDLNNLNDQQLDVLHRVAKDAVDSTQFNYSQMNKPEVLQGPIRRLVGQFQQYRLNMLAMMAKDIRDAMGGNNATPEERSLARKTLAYMVGTQLALTGAVGTALSPVAFAIMDAFGSDDEDFVDSRTEFVNSVPTFMAHGLIGGALKLDPGRVEVGSVLPFLGDRNYAPNTDDFSESAAYYLERNIGPWFGLTTGVAKGVMDMFNGDMYEASQGILPKPASDVLRSIHEREGVRNNQGVVTYDTGVWDSVTRAVGLRSQGMAEAQGRAGAAYQASANIRRARQNRLVELATARAIDDKQAYAEAMQRIKEWNSKNPEFAIKGQDIGRLFVQQARAGQNVERYGVPLSRQITPGFSEAATL